MKIHEFILGIVVFTVLLACVLCDRLLPSGGGRRSGRGRNDEDGSELLNILSVRSPEEENQPPSVPFSQQQPEEQA